MSAPFLAAFLSYHVYKFLSSLKISTLTLSVKLICSENGILWVSTLILPRIKQIVCQVRIHLFNAVIRGVTTDQLTSNHLLDL